MHFFLKKGEIWYETYENNRIASSLSSACSFQQSWAEECQRTEWQREQKEQEKVHKEIGVQKVRELQTFVININTIK